MLSIKAQKIAYWQLAHSTAHRLHFSSGSPASPTSLRKAYIQRMSDTTHRGRAREIVDKAINNVRNAMRSFSRDKKRTKPKSRSRKRPPTSDATISATAKSSRSHDQFDVETHPLWATLPTFTAQQWRESAKQEDNLRGMISSISTREINTLIAA